MTSSQDTPVTPAPELDSLLRVVRRDLGDARHELDRLADQVVRLRDPGKIPDTLAAKMRVAAERIGEHRAEEDRLLATVPDRV